MFSTVTKNQKIIKTIEFVDLDNKVTKTFEEFIEYVKEITRRVIILCHIEQEVQFLQFRTYVLLRKKQSE